MQVRSDGENLLALDQHVGAREVAHVRVHRHHRAVADDVTSSVPAAVLRRVVVRPRGARCEQVETSGRGASRRRAFEECPARSEMRLQPALIA
jgi:hypothetical protein